LSREIIVTQANGPTPERPLGKSKQGHQQANRRSGKKTPDPAPVSTKLIQNPPGTNQEQHGIIRHSRQKGKNTRSRTQKFAPVATRQSRTTAVNPNKQKQKQHSQTRNNQEKTTIFSSRVLTMPKERKTFIEK